MNTSKLLATGGVILALLLGVFNMFNKSTVNVGPTQFGAVPTLDGVDNPFTSIGGVKTALVTQSLIATSSTICSVKNPLATSTLLSFTVNIATGILGANTMSISTSSGTYATSTPPLLRDRNIASQVGDTFVWLPGSATTTTNVILPGVLVTGESTDVINPGQYVSLRLATTTGAGALATYYTGQCRAVFRQL